MKINSSYILLKEIRCYAYHGVAPQENLIGNEYLIDLKLKVDISKAARTDEVTDTVNYAEVHQVIKNEMAIPNGNSQVRSRRHSLFHWKPIVQFHPYHRTTNLLATPYLYLYSIANRCKFRFRKTPIHECYSNTQ